MIRNLIDFRGGYHTDTPNELMSDNDLLLAENCQWRNGIIKRNGISVNMHDDFSSYAGVKGSIRAYSDRYSTIIALDDGSDVRFFRSSGSVHNFYEIDSDFTFLTGKNVEFANMNKFIVAVNGYDKPAIMYFDDVSGWVIKNLEEYDIRTREKSEWYAGQYTASGEIFTDDTTDAQDSGADDFQVCSNTNEDGCFISCDTTFNKIIFKSCQQAAGSPGTITYSYWNGTEWTNITPIQEPSWTDAEGDKTLEFDIPLDSNGELLWEYYNQSTELHLANKFIILIEFGAAPSSAFSCDSLELYHSQYLTQIMQNERPQFVYAHNSRIFLAANNTINYSPYGSITGWRAGEVEYFIEGGPKIISMCSYVDSLLIFKENTIYLFSGTNYEDFTRSMPLSHVGTIAKRSPVTIGGYVFFIGRDGIYAWQGSESVKISKHIETDIKSYTLTEACAIFYQNEYWVSFPSQSVVLTMDVDTLRSDESGDKKISIFKFTEYKVSNFMYNKGAADNGYLEAIVDKSSPLVIRCDYGAQDNLETASSIDMKLMIKYLTTENFQLKKYIGRIKVKLKEVSNISGSSHALTLYSDEGDVSEAITITVPAGNGYYSEDIKPHYDLDGKNLSLLLRHNLNTSCSLVGYSIEIKERNFACL